LPTGRDVATGWAKEHKYPLKDKSDLARVAEYVGIAKEAPMYPKHVIWDEFKKLGKPQPDVSEPHAVLARLPISVYLTTNYVDWMAEALRAEKKKPRVEFCRWNKAIEHLPTRLPPEFDPDASNPIVYHLHGHLDEPQSMVLTEADYVEFLVAVARRRDILEHQIVRALANKMLLFIGFSFADWDFKVIYGGIVGVQQAAKELGVTVQFPERTKAASKYLEAYYSERDLRVYWGDAREFLAELARRWDSQ
jgi:hypothetical protein